MYKNPFVCKKCKQKVFYTQNKKNGDFIMNLRTDLAVESIYTHSGDGIEEKNEKVNDVNITTIHIKTDDASKEVGKPKGTYITLESAFIFKNDPQKANEISKELSEQIKKLIKEVVSDFCENTNILVCGLGNRNITADALGPQCTKGVMVTNHVIEILNHKEKDFSKVSAITPGVMGITGIETNQIIKGVIDEYKPDLLITVDALCAKSAKRMFGTIQLTNTGINPGSGVGNRRASISKETMGVPVISIGIPTVVDANSIVYDALTSFFKKNEVDDNYSKLTNKILENVESLFVSPKDIDELIKRGAKIIANGINLSLHKNIDFSFIESYIA